MRAMENISKRLQNNGIIKLRNAGSGKEQQKTTKQWNKTV